MPYRHTPTNTDLCLICNETTLITCANCTAPHCSEHLVGASCAGCSGELWAIERRWAKSVKLVYGAVAIPAVVAMGFTVGLGIMPLAGVGAVLAGFTVGRVAPLFIRRRLAERRLLPTSQPQPEPSLDAPTGEPRVRPRPRFGIKPYRSRAPRAVFMTRGGYFYQ